MQSLKKIHVWAQMDESTPLTKLKKDRLNIKLIKKLIKIKI